MRDALKSFASNLVRVTENIGAALMLAIIIVNFLQVFFRYVMLDPLGWTEEVMRYAVVWVTFLTAGAVLWYGEHMVVDALEHVCPPWLRRVHRLAVLAAIVAFCLVMVVHRLAAGAAQSAPVLALGAHHDDHSLHGGRHRSRRNDRDRGHRGDHRSAQ